jgi:hypothetical protein
MKRRCPLCNFFICLCAVFALGKAAEGDAKTATMQLIQVSGGDEFVTSVAVKIGDGNKMTIEMPGRENISVEFSRKAGGIIKFAVTEIEMGKLRTMHFIGTGFQDGKLTGEIVFIEDGKLQEDISGRFLLDDVFDW